ncbi:unnamed protein product [Nippostrongylus brasiliensis]|uniref:Transposase n=1 Tax=Nippostrongylus brasiliensis TaxID=27835 RepID=A0A0N4YQ40_NIPBR|nr:unnamed protein product [Nippostrongylus brasiliensis]
MNLLRCPRSEEEAIAYLQVKGLIPLKHLCPRGHNMRLYLGKQNRWKCTKENCTNSSYSIRSGTWFACSKLPFVDIIRFIYCWSEELTSVKFCEKELNLSKTTVVDWNKYMREVVAKEILSQPKKKIGGQNLIVEIEGLLCTREVNEKGNHSLEERWIFGGHASDDLFDSALEAIKNFGVQGSGNPADILPGDKT